MSLFIPPFLLKFDIETNSFFFLKKQIHFHCFNRYIFFFCNSRTELNNNNDIIYARSFLSSLRINDNFFFRFCWCVILLISHKHTRIYRSLDSIPRLKSNIINVPTKKMVRILYTILKIYLFAYLMCAEAIECIVCACVCVFLFFCLTIFGPIWW